ncbi:hypothetical protein G3488_15835 [Shewanella baltica]|uniref:hypothetical protein n=1 Tax=Shewanella baltica TaxID=62322 RepID=UPI00217E21C1|nr:hypothetical protein [Shewanella baltica]MCS6232323.1 hypothetical protein [Shewanella baltica]
MAFETISLGSQPAGTGGDTARTAFEKVNRNFLAADVLAAAMSQAQFDAIRGQNKERYAASGWVSFGNHESGKQVNECKSGLYTTLTTPNTLLIGKSGGVGGSKTDNAVVHIDGVVFNLTNQFVLTLPSHPTSVLPERMDMYGVESEKVEISSAAPNAYQGGLREVGAEVNLFTATDQQKKDFFAQNSNTTFIGSDGKIYQWQLYKISFAGTTDGVPSPTEQGYSLNSLGDLWLKAGKNLLYFCNVLRLNDGGYHPSHNPLGAAKFVGDTFWYNTATSITSKADCFNPSKLLAGSGSITSGKSGRPEIGGRYYDAVYADGYGGVCRDMRYQAYKVTSEDHASADLQVKRGDYRGFEHRVFTKVIYVDNPDHCTAGVVLNKDTQIVGWISGFRNVGQPETINMRGGTVAYVVDGELVVKVQLTGEVVDYVDGTFFARCLFETNSPPASTIVASISTYLVIEEILNTTVGGRFLQTDAIGAPPSILAIPSVASGFEGSWIPDMTNAYLPRPLSSDSVSDSAAMVETVVGSSFTAYPVISLDNVLNTITTGYAPTYLGVVTYQAFASQTEIAPNAALYGLLPYNVFASSDYRPENGALLGESLIGKVLKNNSGVSVNNKSLLSCSIDGSGKLTSAANFDGVTHPPLTLGAPANNSPAFKVVSYLANINQQAVPHFAYTELRHNGTSFGDDGKQTIVDNQSTKPNDHGVTVSVGTARLREPIGWFKNKV